MQWIPVNTNTPKDKLPVHYQEVWVTTAKGEVLSSICLNYVDCNGYWQGNDGLLIKDVIAWQSRAKPKPYIESNQKKNSPLD